MINLIGWFALVIGILQHLALWASAYKIDTKTDAERLRRSFTWIGNPLWFICVVLCWR